MHVQADPPDPLKLPPDDIRGVTVLFLSCSYQGKVALTHQPQQSLHLFWPLMCCQLCIPHKQPRQNVHSANASAKRESVFRGKQGMNVQEFIRVGYYINNEYWEEELIENPPERPIIER